MSKTINQRVAMYRKLLGYSQSQIAEMLGKKSSTYSQCERTGTFNCDTIISLAEIFNVDVRVLLYGEIPDTILPPPPPPKPKYTATEQNIIKIIRNLPKNKRDDVLNYIAENYKNRKSSK